MIAAARCLPAGLARHAQFAAHADLVLATLATNILSLALPIMTLQVYDRILPNPGTGTLWALIVCVIGAIALEAALRASRSYLLGWSAAAFEHRASCEAVARVLDADLSRFDVRGVGEQLHRLNAIGRLKDVYSGAWLSAAVDIAFVTVFLALIAYLASWLVLAPVAVLAVFVLHAVFAGGRLKDGLESRDRLDDQRYDFLIDALEGVHTIKSHALENEFQRRYEHFEKRSSVANFMVTEAASHTFNVGATFSHLMIVVVIVFGAFLSLDGVISSGALIACVLLSGRILQPVQRGLAMWARFQDVQIAATHADEIMSIPQAARPAVFTTPTRQGSLELVSASFRYAEDAPWILSGACFNLDLGEAVAVSGARGAGKSTFLKLLAGVLPPTEGEIRVDGAPVTAIGSRELAARIGYLTTDGALFRGTIRDNITRFGLTPERNAREVAALLGVDRDVAKLASGFDTLLEGSAHDTIPPSLRQRIALTRALAPKPRILLFDNADKALDREGYALVFELLARLRDKTAIVIVSDDENMRSLADRRLLLSGGALTPLPVGRPEQELLAHGSQRP
jgi:ATP-binding cassette subfamily C protein LapB